MTTIFPLGFRLLKLKTIVRGGFYLLLGTLVGIDLAGSGFNASQYFHKSRPVERISALDSFSAPSTAVVVLRQEAEALLFDYTESRDNAWDIRDSRPAIKTDVELDKVDRFRGFRRGSSPEITTIRPLEMLQASVRSLDLDLCQKLLMIYSENHYENELVDTFLRMLKTPECPEVLQWVRIALDCSQRCNRTAEVLDALQHTLRFHPNIRTAESLDTLLQAWQKKHPVRPG
jgi:hypothetical protein